MQEPGHALRSTTTGPRNLFATTLSRRPTATTTNPQVNEVLEDSDDGQDRLGRRNAATSRSSRTRRARTATETTVEPDEDEDRCGDLVRRNHAGNYLQEIPLAGQQELSPAEEQREYHDLNEPLRSIQILANPTI